MKRIIYSIEHYVEDVTEVCSVELRRVFSNSVALMVFFLAGLGYPIIFNLIYHKENLENVPVAVVDDARCKDSQRFIHKADATPEIEVRYECNTLQEAKTLMDDRKVNGIIYFPEDYGDKLANLETARICLFCDMSSFLYYKNTFMATNFAMIDEMKNIELTRYNMTGITGEQATALVTPVDYDEVQLFVPGGGFTSFLIPALLILVIHQTLVFGIGVMGGTARENGTELEIIPRRMRNRRVTRVVFGRALAYLLLYLILIAINLFLIPRIFGLPHVGRLSDQILFFLPFLLATIFLGITLSAFVRTRESGIVSFVFFSIILLFLSGFAWPHSSFPTFWRWFAYLFPSTHATQGFVRINSLGANLSQVRFEYLMLWIQTAVYFVTACASVIYTGRRCAKKNSAATDETAAESVMIENQ